MAPSVGRCRSFRGPDRKRDSLPPCPQPPHHFCLPRAQPVLLAEEEPRTGRRCLLCTGTVLWPLLCFSAVSLWITERKQAISTDGRTGAPSSLSPLRAGMSVSLALPLSAAAAGLADLQAPRLGARAGGQQHAAAEPRWQRRSAPLNLEVSEPPLSKLKEASLLPGCFHEAGHTELLGQSDIKRL